MGLRACLHLAAYCSLSKLQHSKQVTMRIQPSDFAAATVAGVHHYCVDKRVNGISRRVSVWCRQMPSKSGAQALDGTGFQLSASNRIVGTILPHRRLSAPSVAGADEITMADTAKYQAAEQMLRALGFSQGIIDGLELVFSCEASLGLTRLHPVP